MTVLCTKLILAKAHFYVLVIKDYGTSLISCWLQWYTRPDFVTAFIVKTLIFYRYFVLVTASYIKVLDSSREDIYLKGTTILSLLSCSGCSRNCFFFTSLDFCQTSNLDS